jgi:hypothetical protein
VNDPLNRLETELTGMRPAPISAELADRIEGELKAAKGSASPWPDRFLLSAICSGALAACVIIAVVFGGGVSPAPPGGAIVANSAPSRPWAAPLALAQCDPAWGEILK